MPLSLVSIYLMKYMSMIELPLLLKLMGERDGQKYKEKDY